MTRLESDGNLYQLQVIQVQEGESMLDKISFAQYLEPMHEDSEISFADFNTILETIFQ
jgi:hypothetical protein